MNELSLFTGAGGGVLGTKLLGWETIGYVEYENYCQKILKQRIADGFLDAAPIFGDVRRFISEGYAKEYQGMVDVITAGFPCQPFSVAGKGLGVDDPRNMWPQTIEVIRTVRPRFALLENVPGLLTHEYTRQIFGELAESGYDCRWQIISAAEVGAPHKRDRLWIMAHSKSERAMRKPERVCKTNGGQGRALSWEFGKSSNVAHSKRSGTRGQCKDRTLSKNGRDEIQFNGLQTTEAVDAGRNGDGKRDNVADTDPQGIQGSENARSVEGSGAHTDQQPVRHGCEWWKIDPADLPDPRCSGIYEPGQHGNVISDESVCGRKTGNVIQGGEEKEGQSLPDTEGVHAQGQHDRPRQGQSGGEGWRPVESRVGRVANGVAHRVDRLKAIGNGQVSAVVRTAWELLTRENQI